MIVHFNITLKQIKIFISTVLLVGLMVSCKKNGILKPTSQPIAYSSNESGNREIYLANVDGTSQINITNNPGADGYPEWSPDGKYIAFYSKYDQNKTWSIHIMNSDGTNRKRLTHAKNKWDSSPTWSPNGGKIAFAREYRDSLEIWHEEIWMMNADGSELTKIPSLNGIAPCFLQNGRILFQSKGPNSEICISTIDGSKIDTLTHNTAQDGQPTISPDNKQIVFISDRDGNQEVYIMLLDGSHQKRLTFNKVADWDPFWSPDGTQIIFASETETYLDLYLINRDGTMLKKFLDDGSQPSWLNLKNQ